MVDHPVTGAWVTVLAVVLAVAYFALLGCAVWLDFRKDIERRDKGQSASRSGDTRKKNIQKRKGEKT